MSTQRHIKIEQIVHVVLIGGLLFLTNCAKTPDPDYLPMNLAEEKTPPWDATIYSASELASFFPDTNYASLTSVYVAVNGSSDGDGSIGNPYNTIQTAIDNHQDAGVIIRIQQGIYQEHISITTTATSQTDPFVLIAEDGPGTAIIDGQGMDQDIVSVNGRYIVIDGLAIRNTGEYGVLFGTHSSYTEQGGYPSYSVLRNCTVHTTGRDAVKCGHVDFILIENNDIANVTNKIQSDNCIDGVACYHTLCRYNYIHDNQLGHGGYFKGGSANNIWHGNIFKNIGADNTSIPYALGAGLQLGGTGQGSHRDDAWYDYPNGYEQLAFNNLFINCKTAGILVVSCWKAKIFNNSFYNCGNDVEGNVNTAIIRVMDGEFSTLPNEDLSIFNNAFYNESGREVDVFFEDNTSTFDTPAVTHGYNMGMNSNGIVPWNFPDGNSNNDEQVDPIYIDPANGNLDLAPGSPGIDSGKELQEVGFDYNGNLRPQGAAMDRGAYEK